MDTDHAQSVEGSALFHCPAQRPYPPPPLFSVVYPEHRMDLRTPTNFCFNDMQTYSEYLRGLKARATYQASSSLLTRTEINAL